MLSASNTIYYTTHVFHLYTKCDTFLRVIDSSIFNLHFEGINCAEVFTLNAAFKEIKPIPYTSGSTQKKIIGDWNTHYTNADENECPINQCLFYQHNIKTTEYSYSDIAKTSGYPWTYMAEENRFIPKTIKFQFSCHSG